MKQGGVYHKLFRRATFVIQESEGDFELALAIRDPLYVDEIVFQSHVAEQGLLYPQRRFVILSLHFDSRKLVVYGPPYRLKPIAVLFLPFNKTNHLFLVRLVIMIPWNASMNQDAF